MQNTTSNFLNALCDKNILYEDDKTQIIHMYNNITEYAYDHLFTDKTEFNILHYFNGKSAIDNPQDKITTENDWQHMYNLQTLDYDNIYRGTIISDDKNTIFKVFIINAEHIWKEQYCIQYLIELYFTMKINDIIKNNDTLISPEVQKWGRVNLNNNLIMFFFELPYYGLNNINITDDVNTLLNTAFDAANSFLKLLQENNLYFDAFSDHIKEMIKHIDILQNAPTSMLVEQLHNAGMIKYNNKFVVFDYKHVFRSPVWVGLLYSLWNPPAIFSK